MFSQPHPIEKNTSTIVDVHSLDFHECVFNQYWLLFTQNFQTQFSEEIILNYCAAVLAAANASLFENIKKTAEDTGANKIIFMLGSGCQSYIDDYRHRLKGKRREQPISVFQGLSLLHEIGTELLATDNLSIDLDPYLLADSFDDLPSGQSYERAIQARRANLKTLSHANWVLDETKLLIVYAQVHHAISPLWQDAQLNYYFYDDKKEILFDLNEFYQRNTQLIPSGCTLILSQYLGGKPVVLYLIKGTGIRDARYSESVKKIVELCGYPHDFITITRIAKVFTSELVDKFLAWRNLPIDEAALAFLPRSVSFSHSRFFKPVITSDQVTKILSFDADKCIYNAVYLKLMDKHFEKYPDMSWGQFLEFQNKSLCAANANLLKQIALEIATILHLEKVKLILGSGRQSYADDMINRLTGPVLSGSAYQALLMLRNRIEYELSLLGKNIVVEVDQFLLSDVYANLEAGDNYKMALAQMHVDANKWRPNVAPQIVLANAEKYPTWVFDDSKLTLIYSQIHESRNNISNKDNFDYYDDRMDLLENLAGFFGNNLQFIPKGTTVILYEYAGEERKQVAVLKGEGDLDFCYAESVKKMVELSGHDPSSCTQIINVLKGFNHPANVQTFLEWRKLYSEHTEQVLPIKP